MIASISDWVATTRSIVRRPVERLMSSIGNGANGSCTATVSFSSVFAIATMPFLRANGPDSAPVTSARAALELARKAPSAVDIEGLRAKLADNPQDAQSRFDLALALNAKGDRNGALEELLALVAKNRSWDDDAARKQLLQLFDAWGVSDPATIAGRQRLSSLLFA